MVGGVIVGDLVVEAVDGALPCLLLAGYEDDNVFIELLRSNLVVTLIDRRCHALSWPSSSVTSPGGWIWWHLPFSILPRVATTVSRLI